MSGFCDWTLSVSLLLALLSGAHCNEDAELVDQRLTVLENGVGVLTNRFDALSIDKADIIFRQEQQILSLKTELTNNIKQRVEAALSDVLRGDAFEDLIRSEVVSEMRHLKRSNHQMRRQLHEMKTSLEQVQTENRMYQKVLQKAEEEDRETMMCSKHIANSELLSAELAKSNGHISVLQLRIREMNESCKASIRSKEETTSMATVLTTAEPSKERSKILIAPFYHSTYYQFHQVYIHSNIVSSYPYISQMNYVSVIYIPTLKSLMIGTYHPNRIISCPIYRSGMVIVREKVQTRGMALDERRKTIFLTTWHPSNTISKMSIHGKNFTSIVSLPSGSTPHSVAVNPDTQTVYACNGGKLFSVRYDGRGLRTLDSGSGFYAVTLDIGNGLLYYSKYKKLMKWSLSHHSVSEVTPFGFYTLNLIYYRGKVYYTSYNGPGTIGVVDIGHNAGFHTLQTKLMDGVTNYVMCLIP